MVEQSLTQRVASDSPTLVIGPSWVGDMVMAQTLFKILKRQQPDTNIEVLAPAWSRPILQRMPEVNAAIVMPVGHGKLGLLSRWQLAQTLRPRRYRSAYVLPNSLKSALIPFFAGIPRRVGWRGEMRFGLINDIRLLDRERYPRMVQRFAALAYPAERDLPSDLPHPHLQVATQRIEELINKFELRLDQPVLVMCPGAEFGSAKRWPDRYFQWIATAMIERGWYVWLMGSANDREVSKKIRSALTEKESQSVYNLAGRTELADAIDLMSCAGVVVTNDSGLMHIAAAVNRPLVAIYGATSPAFTPPLGEQTETLAIPVDCGPCFKRDCPLQHLKCLNELAPELVLAAIDRALAKMALRGEPV